MSVYWRVLKRDKWEDRTGVMVDGDGDLLSGNLTALDCANRAWTDARS